METFGERGEFVTRLSGRIRSLPAVARLDSSPQLDKKYDKSACFSTFIFGAERNRRLMRETLSSVI